MKTTLIYNAVYCTLCEETIQSYHRHDYKHCTCRNAMVDGGLDYNRWGWETEGSVINHSLYLESSPFSVIRQHFYRWNHNTQTYVTLDNIDDAWLENILKWYIPSDVSRGDMNPDYLLLFLQEKLYRSEQED
jgi:hypothetical protein